MPTAIKHRVRTDGSKRQGHQKLRLTQPPGRGTKHVRPPLEVADLLGHACAAVDGRRPQPDVLAQALADDVDLVRQLPGRREDQSYGTGLADR